ncbi:MAG: hypothetical protein L0Y71_25525 [Gemmataceae bacterium]|nr:hypothetical protein [Gemmataceae bacterium]
MDFDSTKILANARAAATDDLLDRVTVYRAGMEPEAVDIIEMELRRRGVTDEDIAAHGEQHHDCMRDQDGNPLMCSWCRKPAVAEGWGLHRIWGLVPAFPRLFRYCAEHRPVEHLPEPDEDHDP